MFQQPNGKLTFYTSVYAMNKINQCFDNILDKINRTKYIIPQELEYDDDIRDYAEDIIGEVGEEISRATGGGDIISIIDCMSEEIGIYDDHGGWWCDNIIEAAMLFRGLKIASIYAALIMGHELLKPGSNWNMLRFIPKSEHIDPEIDGDNT